MIDAAILPKYIPTIGIECHVQLNTRTKLFAAVGNDARSAAPNTLISHICIGMPGALPVLNQKVVEYAIKVAKAFDIKPQNYSFFERKHYFYPDLPKGYQITQLSHPIIKGGKVRIESANAQTEVRINRVQIEEDAGKSTHPAGQDYSLVDLNRAGTPLFEIVSEPDIHSPAAAKTYARELWLLMRYCQVSDADMYQGNMRFDVNVSVSKDTKNLGTRTETKNLNSFRSVEKAVEYEIKRQVELLEKGQSVTQETRGWDDAKQKTFSQRTKEEAHDYRYFPDPDIPPIELEDSQIKSAQTNMPRMPYEWRSILAGFGLNREQIEILLEAELDAEATSYLTLIEQAWAHSGKEFAKKLADWFINTEIPIRRSGEAHDSDYKNQERYDLYAQVYEMLKQGRLSSTNAKALLETIIKSGAKPKKLEEYTSQQGLLQVSDQSAIEDAVKAVIIENETAANDVRNGEMKAIGFLVGQVMKKTEGKANPSMAQELIRKLLY